MARGADFDNLAAVLPSIVDEAVGLIDILEEVRREPGGPNFFHYRAQASNTSAFSRETNFKHSGGASAIRESAMAKAIGEALERYCPALFDFEELLLCSWREAPSSAVEPEEWALYAPDQYAEPGFPWQIFDRDTPVRWTDAVDLSSGRKMLVPAARVYMPYNYYLGTGDTPIDQPISTGLACHRSFERAALVGLYEVIERDAVMLSWQARLSPPHIRIESLPDDIYGLVQRFERTGLRIDMLSITTDNGVPTILSTARGQNDLQPALVVAASASLDPGEAARKSLEELAHTRRYCQWVKTNLAPLAADPPDYEIVTDQLTHLAFFVDQSHAPLADFLFEGDRRTDFDEIPDCSAGDAAADLDRVVALIGATGDRCLVADLTTPDVASLGLAVVRAMVPGYQPLHMGFRLRARGGKRLYCVPQRMGYAGLAQGQSDNPVPHPYP